VSVVPAATYYHGSLCDIVLHIYGICCLFVARAFPVVIHYHSVIFPYHITVRFTLDLAPYLAWFASSFAGPFRRIVLVH